MMKMNWQQGVMLGLFAGGFLIGTGGVVGLADERKPYDLQINYYIAALDEGLQESRRFYTTEKVRVTPGEALNGRPELAVFLSNTRSNAKAPDPSTLNGPMNWTYSGTRKFANVKLKYVNTKSKLVVSDRMIRGNVTVGGKLNISAPTGYQLVNADDTNRIVKSISEEWHVMVTPKTTTTGSTEPDESGTSQPEPQPTKPGESEPEKPSEPDSNPGDMKPGEPNSGETKPEKPTPEDPNTTPHPGGNPAPIQPTTPSPIPHPQPTLPLTPPSSVVTDRRKPVGKVPTVTVPRPHVTAESAQPNTDTNLDHVSELTEHPITAITDDSLATMPATTTKPSQGAKKPHSEKLPVGGRQWRVSSTRRQKLPQTNEQTSKGSLLGLVALAGIGLSRFWRFRD
ncbi:MULTISPECIES: LPXTG cell wall anchor domain-containing protein [Lactobacillaceae]|uniref:LPXTG cell wall anchor domain-containing protein n=1 Tax=Lactobacillaceae TaxID=33958 RepID=UPI0014569DA8|nr:LPXTG cell wall anchor domain-containing protein [Lactobacillus sp. HBUAS51381]NLR09501.1 LPXTG cell wall anchor domain-containing protein [Lactobacillus sp. HBUAS51381]